MAANPLDSVVVPLPGVPDIAWGYHLSKQQYHKMTAAPPVVVADGAAPAHRWVPIPTKGRSVSPAVLGRPTVLAPTFATVTDRAALRPKRLVASRLADMAAKREATLARTHSPSPSRARPHSAGAARSPHASPGSSRKPRNPVFPVPRAYGDADDWSDRQSVASEDSSTFKLATLLNSGILLPFDESTRMQPPSMIHATNRSIRQAHNLSTTWEGYASLSDDDQPVAVQPPAQAAERRPSSSLSQSGSEWTTLEPVAPPADTSLSRRDASTQSSGTDVGCQTMIGDEQFQWHISGVSSVPDVSRADADTSTTAQFPAVALPPAGLPADDGISVGVHSVTEMEPDSLMSGVHVSSSRRDSVISQAEAAVSPAASQHGSHVPGSAVASRRGSHVEPASSAVASRRGSHVEPAGSAVASRRGSHVEAAGSPVASRRGSHLEPASSAVASRRGSHLEPASSAVASRRGSHVEPAGSAAASRRCSHAEPAGSAVVSRHGSHMEPGGSAVASRRGSNVDTPAFAAASRRGSHAEPAGSAVASRRGSHPDTSTTAATSRRGSHADPATASRRGSNADASTVATTASRRGSRADASLHESPDNSADAQASSRRASAATISGTPATLDEQVEILAGRSRSGSMLAASHHASVASSRRTSLESAATPVGDGVATEAASRRGSVSAHAGEPGSRRGSVQPAAAVPSPVPFPPTPGDTARALFVRHIAELTGDGSVSASTTPASSSFVAVTTVESTETATRVPTAQAPSALTVDVHAVASPIPVSAGLAPTVPQTVQVAAPWLPAQLPHLPHATSWRAPLATVMSMHLGSGMMTPVEVAPVWAETPMMSPWSGSVSPMPAWNLPVAVPVAATAAPAAPVAGVTEVKHREEEARPVSRSTSSTVDDDALTYFTADTDEALGDGWNGVEVESFEPSASVEHRSTIFPPKAATQRSESSAAAFNKALAKLEERRQVLRMEAAARRVKLAGDAPLTYQVRHPSAFDDDLGSSSSDHESPSPVYAAVQPVAVAEFASTVLTAPSTHDAGDDILASIRNLRAEIQAAATHPGAEAPAPQPVATLVDLEAMRHMIADLAVNSQFDLTPSELSVEKQIAHIKQLQASMLLATSPPRIPQAPMSPPAAALTGARGWFS